MQLSLDPAQQVAGLMMDFHRSINDTGGFIGVTVLNDNGLVLGKDLIRWRKPHDVEGFSVLARKVTDAYLWGSASDVLLAFRTAFREHVDALDIDAQGELLRGRTSVPIKRRSTR